MGKLFDLFMIFLTCCTSSRTGALAKMGVHAEKAVQVGGFNTDQKHFLDYHREEILLNAAM